MTTKQHIVANRNVIFVFKSNLGTVKKKKKILTEFKKRDVDGVPVSRDQTWNGERETEESSDEEYHESSPLDWGYISSSLSSLRSNLWWRES